MLSVPALSGSDCIDLGVDYFTATTRTQKQTETARSLVVEITDIERRKGNDVSPWRMAGYEGLKVGQLQFGFRDQSLIVRLSGDLAKRECWRFYELVENVSRIDLQITSDNGSSGSGIVVDCAKRAARFKSERNHRRTLTLIKSDDGSATLYIGKRSSDYYGRIYTKGMMHGSAYPPCAIRAEVEIKNSPANRTFEALVQSRNRSMSVASVVATWFGRVGLPISDFPDTFDLYKGFAPAPDDERRLEWLKTQVRGCVGILKDSGRAQEVLEALGLADICFLLKSDVESDSDD